jgi:hypothetical protein
MTLSGQSDRQPPPAWPCSVRAFDVLCWMVDADAIGERIVAMRWGPTLAQALIDDGLAADVAEAGRLLAELGHAGLIAGELTGSHQ